MRSAVCATAAEAGRRERDALRHQRLLAAPPQIREANRARDKRAGLDRSRSASHARRRRLREWRTRGRRRGRRRGSCKGHRQRATASAAPNANLVTIMPALQLRCATTSVSGGSARAPDGGTDHMIDEDRNVAPNRNQALRVRKPFAAQGRDAIRGERPRTRASSKHINPAAVRTTAAELLVSERCDRPQTPFSSASRGWTRADKRCGPRALVADPFQAGSENDGIPVRGQRTAPSGPLIRKEEQATTSRCSRLSSSA